MKHTGVDYGFVLFRPGVLLWWEVWSEGYNLDWLLNSKQGLEELRHAIWVPGVQVLPGYTVLAFACVKDQAHESISSDSESMQYIQIVLTILLGY